MLDVGVAGHLTSVWLWISTPNFSSTLFVSVDGSLLSMSYNQLRSPVTHCCPCPKARYPRRSMIYNFYLYVRCNSSSSPSINGRFAKPLIIGMDEYPHHNLTHWGRVTHICVSKLTIIGSDNGLSPGRRHAIIWTYDGILLIGPLGTNFSEILVEIWTFSFTKMWLKVSSAKWRPFCLGLNELMCL